MCFDVNDCATQAEAHTSRKDASGTLSAEQARFYQRRPITVIFSLFGGEIKKSRLHDPLLHAAKKNHSNFILSVL
jgi:hypothetical protein